MKKLIVELSNERLITPSGLALVGGALGKSDLVKRANRTKVDSKRSQPQIKNGDILLSYIGLLCQGKTCYEAVQEFHEDPAYYKYALGIAYAIPSVETLRQRMDLIGSSMRDDILQANVTMFHTLDIHPTPLENEKVPLDLDVTPFDNSKTRKEGVSRTYKGFDGYAPMMAYLGAEGYMVNTDDTVIELYHAHGESEQYHSEIKTDMDVERLPSGKFDTNELVLELTVLAYNILRIIGQNSLKSKRAPKTKRPVKRRRIRTVISNLILIAGHVTEHARRVVLSLGCSNIWRHIFLDLYQLLVA